ncbi:MAG: hypothetical protein RI958_115 [Actinomycetota bacterium]|jgi:uncharacterized surface protein with fasciclin (FAS1) repeats
MSHRRSLSVAALACLFLVSACGGSDDDATTTQAPATEASAPADTEPAETMPAETVPADTMPADTMPAETSPTTEVALGSIIDVATAAGEFTTLLAAVDAAGLTETLATSKVTVLAPTDAAFEALGQAAIDAVLADPAALEALLLNHVLPAPQMAAQLSIFSNAVTLGGGSLPVALVGSDLTIGGATVITADVMADNGVIHVIDTVIVPAAG